MSITRLNNDDQARMKAEPEVVMNIQIARRNDGYVIVVGGRIAMSTTTRLLVN
jgi:hypothetical protein